jgi:hypothetical protein
MKFIVCTSKSSLGDLSGDDLVVLFRNMHTINVDDLDHLKG